MSDLHTALKTRIIRDVKSDPQFIQVELQHGKDSFAQTLHAKPSTFSTSGLQTSDFLSFLGFRRSSCAFLRPECYVRQIPAGFEVQKFADAFEPAFKALLDGAKHLEACGIFLNQPEGWGYFTGAQSLNRKFDTVVSRGDGHSAAKSERLKNSEDQYFRFAFTWLEGNSFKGWVTHIRPLHPPLSPEFDAALKFLGSFQSFDNCPEFDFEPCRWRSFQYSGEYNYSSPDSAETAHRYFDAHATHFSAGIQKLLAAHSYLVPQGISFLDVRATSELKSSTAPLATSTGPTSTTKPNRKYSYDLAISFAGTERAYAETLANYLRAAGFVVFYDGFYPEQLWGKDLTQFFDRVYRKESRYCVMFVSNEYATRIWTSHERRSALARMLQENGAEYILPVRVDDTDLDGLPPTIGYLSLRQNSIQKIGDILINKLRAVDKT